MIVLNTAWSSSSVWAQGWWFEYHVIWNPRLVYLNCEAVRPEVPPIVGRQR